MNMLFRNWRQGRPTHRGHAVKSPQRSHLSVPVRPVRCLSNVEVHVEVCLPAVSQQVLSGVALMKKKPTAMYRHWGR